MSRRAVARAAWDDPVRPRAVAGRCRGGIGGTLEYGTDLLRPRHGRPSGRSAAAAAGGAGRRSGAAARRAAAPGRGGGAPARGGVERHARRAGAPAGCVHELFERTLAARSRAPWPCCRRRAPDPTRARRGGRTGWRAGCGGWASARRCRWASASSARSSWWSPCSPSSRRAAPTSRSNPAYPRERLALLLADTGAPVAADRGRLLERLPRARGAVSASTSRLATSRSPASRGSASRALGRGAEPGLRHLHLGLDRSAEGGRPCPTEADRLRLVRERVYADRRRDPGLPAARARSFDASTLEIWGPLLNGGRLAIPPAGTLSLEEIGRAIVPLAEVTTIWLTSGLFRLMVGPPASRGSGRLRQLLGRRRRAAAGAVARVLDLLPACRLINGYGPTENTAFTTAIASVERRPGRGAVPIGRPIGNATGPHAGRRDGGRCRRRRRRDLRRRRRPRPRLLGPPGADRGAFRPRSRSAAARRAALPHRRPGPLAARRRGSSSSAASTSRSRSAASAWSRGRSRPPSRRHPACPRGCVDVRARRPAGPAAGGLRGAGAGETAPADLRDCL